MDAYSDLNSFAIELAKQFPNQPNVILTAQSVQFAISSTIVASEYQTGTYADSDWNWQNFSGLGVYLPLGWDEARRDFYTNGEIMWAYATSWDEFLTAYFQEETAVRDVADNRRPLHICQQTQGNVCTELAYPFSFEQTVYLPLISK